VDINEQSDSTKDCQGDMLLATEHLTKRETKL